MQMRKERQSILLNSHRRMQNASSWRGVVRCVSDIWLLHSDLQGSIEQELKWLILFLTHWVPTSKASLSLAHPHEY
jgi:hypothetical protein